MSWDLLGQLALLWIFISTIHPTVVVHHVYDDPPEEEGETKKVGFHNSHHKDAAGTKSTIGFRNKEG